MSTLVFEGKKYVFRDCEDLHRTCVNLVEANSLESFLKNSKIYGVNSFDWFCIIQSLTGRTLIEPIFGSPNQLKAVYGKNKDRDAYWVLFTHPFIRDEKNKSKRFKRGVGSDEEFAKEVVEGINLLLSDRSLWTVSDIHSLRSIVNEKVIELFFDQKYLEGTTYPFSCMQKHVLK